MITEPYQLVAEIKKYALDNKVPIMQDEGIDYLINYIKTIYFFINKHKTIILFLISGKISSLEFNGWKWFSCLR